MSTEEGEKLIRDALEEVRRRQVGSPEDQKPAAGTAYLPAALNMQFSVMLWTLWLPGSGAGTGIIFI